MVTHYIATHTASKPTNPILTEEEDYHELMEIINIHGMEPEDLESLRSKMAIDVVV